MTSSSAVRWPAGEIATEGLVGCFINMLAIRGRPTSELSFREFLAQIREKSLAAQEHQSLPFEKVVEAVNPVRNESVTPVFQTIFNYGNLPTVPESPGLLCTEPWDFDPGLAQFDLALTMEDQPDGLRCEWTYGRDLFAEDDIRRLADRFSVLLRSVVAEPAAGLGQLPILPPAERQQVLVDWNQTAADFPRDRCVHELFEAQVERTPDAVAVVFEDQSLTYRQLNRRSNQLADHLRGLGVGPDSLVAMCLDRSLELVVGILGILKAGGAYVPLDASHPRKRLEFTLEDSQAKVLVTQRRLLDRLPQAPAATILIDPQESIFTAAEAGNPRSGVRPENLAYTMFTSGSTGRPKGVQIRHAAVVNFLTTMVDRPGLKPAGRLLSVTTPTFDISVLELLLPLAAGASVEVVAGELLADPAGLATRLAKSGATVMQATPSTWEMLIHHGWDGSRELKVLCGGEALPDSLAVELRRRCGELWNMYGPTETTIWSTILPVTEGRVRGCIGRPIANTQVYVLDALGQPAPIGVPGELLIGGEGLARSYLNRPELTAEKFVPDPFSRRPGARLYRTGDLCRWRADGYLEFLGRMDHQVKLRGFRIELGEVEAVLRQFPGLAQVVVVLREDRPGDKRLVAYYVAEQGQEPDHGTLGRHTRGLLPEYAVPAAFVPLERLPLTPNGKVDRTSLPSPNQSQSRLETGHVPPQSPLERRLAAVWTEVLGLEKVGRNDNFFFDLGGHSLLLARLVARIKQETGKSVPLTVMFREPTIAGLAKYMLRPPTPAIDLIEPVRGSGSRGPVLWFGNGRPLASFSSIVPQEHPIYWCRPEYLDGRRLPNNSLEDKATRYCRQIREAKIEGPFALCGYSFSGLVAFEAARQLEEMGKDVDLVFLLEPTPPVVGLDRGLGPARNNDAADRPRVP